MGLVYGKQFSAQYVSNSVTTIFTLTSSMTTATIRNMRIRLINSSVGAVSVSAYIVPNGGSSGNDNIFYTASLAAGAMIELDVPQMAKGDSLQASAATATSVTIHDVDSVIRESDT